MLGHAVAMRDHDTSAHNVRVALYAGHLGEALCLDRPMIQSLMKGAFLHDVGKIGIPDRILLKEERLTAEEFAIMRRHSELGAQLLADLAWFTDALPVVRHHHERLDGAGYPDGLMGDAIPLAARAFAIVDVFDALVSARPYKTAFPLSTALEMLEAGIGSQFDPQVASTFIPMIRPYYEQFANRPAEGIGPQLEGLRRRHFGV